MRVTEPITKQLALVPQFFKRNYTTKFYENSTEGLVVDIRPQTDGSVPNKSLFFPQITTKNLHKNKSDILHSFHTYRSQKVTITVISSQSHDCKFK